MKHNRLYAKVALLLVGIAVVSLGLTALTTAQHRDSTDTVRIVTSFYPVYIAACNVAEGIDGVEVINMVDNQTGCLHDYQMSPEDRALLETADVFVMNGAGAEEFLTPVLRELSALTVVDLSEGQDLLESGHVHEHEHEHGDAEEHEAVNSHLWVSPPRHRQQIRTLANSLATYDPSHATAYRVNADRYGEEIEAVWTRLQAVAANDTDVPTVLFHDSLAYLAEDLNLQVITALNVGEDSGVSASALADAEDALTDLEEALFFYDAQYSAVQYTYLQELPKTAVSLTVDTVVSGEDDPDAFLNAMTALCNAWEEAV